MLLLMSVIPFPTARRTSTSTGELVCDCGSTWFELTIEGPDGDRPGGVQLDLDGRVVGFAGIPRCRACGATTNTP